MSEPEIIRGTPEGRVRLCAARALGLSENMNDALVLMESFVRTGVIDITIPDQSIMKSTSGEDFIRMLHKALIQFDEDGGWISMTREQIEMAGGAIDHIREDQSIVFYRIANEDGSLPDPPLVSTTGDRIVVFH